MSLASTLPATAPKPPRRRLRDFFAIDEQARIVAFAGTPVGRVLIFAIALLAVSRYFDVWATLLAVSAALTAAWLPKYRIPVLLTATWLATFTETLLSGNDFAEHIGLVMTQEGIANLPAAGLATASLLAVVLGIRTLLAFVRQRPKSLLARRPMLAMLGLEALLCVLALPDFLPGWPRLLIWSLLVVVTPFIWFLPYAVVDQRASSAGPVGMQMAALRPFWSPTYLPFGKGAAYLQKFLAKTPDDLVITQLKAIKLLVWSNLLLTLKGLLGWLFVSHFDTPTVAQTVDAFLQGQPYPIAISWTALAYSTTRFALQIAIWAHLFIGIARLAGYRLPRGSWRPLESRTLMDYFNRFHYYFKELLVDFFFFPTFFSTFRKHPRLRMFFATFMAAAVGNALWHFVRDIDLIARVGLATALKTYASYAFYCVVLATGVGISQIRVNSGIRPSPTLAGKLYSFIFVWSFVVCMHLFSDGSRQHSLGERLSFLTSLFGVI
ncbi:MAG: hypothetical protein WBJ68_12090 [Candidatus Dechloromonas phosphoritropha]